MNKEKLLLEELSVSREVESATDRLKATISSSYKNGDREEFSKNLTLYSGSLIYEAFGVSFGVNYDVYVVYDLDELGRKEYQIASSNYSDIEQNTMNVSLFAYRGEFLTMSDDSLMHEMMHFYQWAKKKQKYQESTQLTSKLYQMAVAVIQDKSLDGTETVKYTECEKIIAWLIYFSDRREQDAYVNGYYAEKRSAKTQNKTPDLLLAMKSFSDYQDMFSEKYGTKEMGEAIKFYSENGLSLKTLVSMVEKANERWESKKKRVDFLLYKEHTGLKDNVRNQISEETFFRDYVKKIVEQTLKEHNIL